MVFLHPFLSSPTDFPHISQADLLLKTSDYASALLPVVLQIDYKSLNMAQRPS